MAENAETVSKGEEPKAPSNGFSLFPKFNLQLPFFRQEPKNAGTPGEDEPREAVVGDDGSQSKIQKPDMVRFPKAELVVPPPVAVENEEPGKTSNPVILWQVICFYSCFEILISLAHYSYFCLVGLKMEREKKNKLAIFCILLLIFHLE